MKNNITEMPDISIVVLCYKTGKKIKSFVANIIQELESNNILNYELVLVGNYNTGTDDETPRIVAEIASNNKKIIYTAQEKTGMMGWDMRSGLDRARGNYITFIDGDGQMPVSDIIRVYKKIKTENLDLVTTYRTTRGDGLWRKSISFCYNIIFSILFPGINSRDINSKPKIFSRDVYNKLDLFSNDWFIDAEIMIQVRRLRLNVAEIPTTFREIIDRKSFVRVPVIFEFIKNLIIFRIREWKYKFKKI